MAKPIGPRYAYSLGPNNTFRYNSAGPSVLATRALIITPRNTIGPLLLAARALIIMPTETIGPSLLGGVKK